MIKRFALAALLRDLLRQGLVLVGLDVLERQVLELPPQLGHTKTMGERRVEVARFLRDADALLRRQILERPHVVQAVGELDDDDARVLGDREEQLAIALDLPLLRRSARRQLGDLREPVDDVGDRTPELLLHVGDRELGVFDDVVEQPGGDGHRIELQLGEDLRDLDRVRDVRLARVAALAAVRLLAEAIGAHEQFAIELVVERRLVFAPTRHHLADGRARGGHSNPASAKLV